MRRQHAALFLLTVSFSATAVSRIDNLEFLSDVIPKTTTYKKFKEKRARESANGAGMLSGQRTLNERRRVKENGSARDRREDSMLDLDGHDDDAHSLSSRPPMVMHSPYSNSSLVGGDSRRRLSADEDIDMTE